MKLLIKVALLAFSVSAITACSSAYYSAMEKVGIHKRDIMVDRVVEAKESQEDAQKQFKSALEELSSIINFNGGELEERYQAIEARYEASKQSADEVSHRIEKIESVAEALFDEWQEEIEQISNTTYKRQSSIKLKETQSRYQTLIKAMHKAESKMQPVLTALKDNTLFLKHNLNAKAIGALQGEVKSIKQDIDILVKEMNSAIKQSQQFIDMLSNNG
jgi:hypothetical protein